MLNQDAPVETPAPEASDRRAAPRVALEVEVGLIEDTNFYLGFVEDISVGGLFVATYELREIGTEIDLRFTFPSGERVEVRGCVRWQRDPRDGRESSPPPGIGIQFEGLTPEDEEVIRDFVQLRAPLFYED